MRSLALLIGFLLMFSFPAGNITILPLGGFALILFSVLRMEKMEPMFKKAKAVLFIALPVSAALLGLQIYKAAGGAAEWYDGVYFATRLLTELCELITMLFIYLGVKIIGVNAEIPALEKHCTRNLTVMLVYFATEILMSVLRLAAPSVFAGFEFVLIYPFVFGYIWRSLNVWMAYTLLTKITVSKV